MRTAPNHYGCYRPESNISIKKKVKTLIKKVEKSTTSKEVKNALLAFIAGWTRMCNNPRHIKNGASDTAVRECVWDVVEKVGQPYFYPDELDSIWDEGRERGWKLRNGK